ncbi:MAG TPA: helix-turn-helix domain-containing protein [Thermoleophilia bacterium]|nr:helix-turn-helix domain-containing protein [Thermoleophilia bacterium]
MTRPTPNIPLTSPFDSQLDLLADALGDPTRRAVFKYVAESAEAVTAADVGATFGVHRTVARAHLERLSDTGLLVSDFLHRPEGGRPPKVYRRSETRLDLQEPVRQYQMLAELLLQALARFGEAGELLVGEIGRDFGRGLADAAGDVDSIEDLLAPLSRAGADIHVETEADRVVVRTGNCLFLEVATKQPRLVCLLDKAIMTGLLSGGDRPLVLTDHQRRGGREACTLVFEAVENGLGEQIAQEAIEAQARSAESRAVEIHPIGGDDEGRARNAEEQA